MESIVSEPEPTVNQTNKRKQATLNHYIPSFTKQDQEELESLLVPCFSFHIPSHHTLSGNLLNKEYKDLKKLVRNFFNETPYFCITSDGWSNVNKAPIVNFMITTQKPIFYKSVYTKEEHHTGENIAK
ncbi:21566_t:CDS:2, partial [Rhizophagus irregularis]